MPRLNASSEPSIGCLECGGVFRPAGPTATFCSSACRRTWNNRRQTRGAELYDLFMALRFDRKTARALRVLSMMNRLASMFRDADRAERGGRRSWTPPGVIVERSPHLRSRILQRRRPA